MFARVSQSMSIFTEKMRQFSARLKSAARQTIQTAQSRVALIAQKPSPDGQKADHLFHDRPQLRKFLRIAAVALGVFLALPYVLILLYRFVDPPVSALMVRNAVLGEGLRYEWTDFGDISPNLPTAVLISEDSRFCTHWGVDWLEVGQVLEDLEDGEAPRGASTIPMQTAKNLFLWPGQDFVRKLLEVPLAYFMNFVWPKQRIVEIYLNIAEWGPGIYGAEAAARHHFNRSASRLNRSQAALLAASLPNPYVRIAGRPGPATRRIASRINSRVSRERADASCIFGSR